jgi:hypothetical protein
MPGSEHEHEDDHVPGDQERLPGADEFVDVTVPVHTTDLASFHAAVAEWARTASGGKGRTRHS